MGKGRSFKVPKEMADRSEPSPRATCRLAAFLAASLAVGLLALSGCGPQVVFDSAGTGTASGGTGGSSGTSGSGGTSTTSTSTTGTTSTSTSTTSTSTTSTSTTSTSTTSTSTTSTTSTTDTTTTTSTTSTTSTTTSSTGPVTVTALPEGSVYRYWDQGSVAAGWAGSGFDDSAWPTGTAPLGFGDAYIVTTVGYGPDPNAKYTATWFRTTFDVASAAAVTTAMIELNVDDGALVFLNGAEWARWNLPDGAIAPSTLASSIVEAGQENQLIASDVDPSLLVDGENVLAIEVHQALLTSTDLGIDARVTLNLN